jgi:DNA mismatch endonuclease (patch repair protein)
MVDVVDTATRSRMMSGIKGKDTAPELAVRRRLFAAGFRYRLHPKEVPGRPDMLFPKHRAAVFVHGCFWHRHPGCRYATTPGTRPEFWAAKFAGNVERDERKTRELLEGGWRAAVVWECALRRGGDAEVAVALAQWLLSDVERFEVP